MSATETTVRKIYNPKTAFGNKELLKLLEKDKIEKWIDDNISACQECDDKGRAECDECDGEGECDHCHHTCDYCGGEGNVRCRHWDLQKEIKGRAD